jgi:hypothetical protein
MDAKPKKPRPKPPTYLHVSTTTFQDPETRRLMVSRGITYDVGRNAAKRLRRKLER